MKKLILLVALLFICVTGRAQQSSQIRDGFYEVYELTNDTKDPGAGKKTLSFNHHFEEDAPKDYKHVVIFTGEFVPLELEKLPELETKKDMNSRLRITLSPEAAGILKTFTEKRVMKHVAIVMDGEALTVHKIRVPITGGNLEISRCNDNACEKLQVMLRDNVKK